MLIMQPSRGKFSYDIQTFVLLTETISEGTVSRVFSRWEK